MPGVGPVTEREIISSGGTTWEKVLRYPSLIPQRLSRNSTRLLAELKRCQEALKEKDLATLVGSLVIRDHWRILAEYYRDISYFDLETDGLGHGASVVVAVIYHRGELLYFVRGENLDDFLDLLEEVKLLVSFNGASFDIPMLCKTWNIPELPCPHIDLRWQSYHFGLSGGLKQIERKLGIKRPRGLRGVDGFEAVMLWERWSEGGDIKAKEKLLRYCAADVLSLAAINSLLLSEKCGRKFFTLKQDLWAEI